MEFDGPPDVEELAEMPANDLAEKIAADYEVVDDATMRRIDAERRARYLAKDALTSLESHFEALKAAILNVCQVSAIYRRHAYSCERAKNYLIDDGMNAALLPDSVMPHDNAIEILHSTLGTLYQEAGFYYDRPVFGEKDGMYFLEKSAEIKPIPFHERSRSAPVE